MKKNIKQFILPKGFLSICWQKSSAFNAKVLPACWTDKPGFYFFSLYKIKTSKQHRFVL